MHRHQRQLAALGSTILLTIVSDAPDSKIADLFVTLHEHIVTFEQTFSRFLPDSELTAFNKRAGHQTPVSSAFRRLLAAARTFGTVTDGLYNPFILPALQRAGYRSSWPHPEADTQLDYTAGSLCDVEQLEIGVTWARIPQNTALDFGGIGKGYLLDELALYMHEQGEHSYWFSLGGDILCCGKDIEDKPWRIGVQNAQKPTHLSHTILNETGNVCAIATSGTTKRRGFTHDKPWHHIIDPRTGRPAQTDILTATVTAADATTADVYAKCVVIGGLAQAKQYKLSGSIRSGIVQTSTTEQVITL